MDTTEAVNLLSARVAELRTLGYESLLEYLTPENRRVEGDSGKEYQIETQAFWDSGQRHKNLRVIAAIDDGGIRALSPLTDDFIISPDGHFVGE
ncbi:MAG: hypothetical protein WD556_07180 [Actinomycetota bacterium]